MAKTKTALATQREAQLLRELALDFDWNAAAQRCGIPPRTLDRMRADRGLAAKGQAIIDKAVADTSGLDDAIKGFKETQEKLVDALDSGDLSIASALIKTHEMEFKMHGLFEKDNKQKGSSVSINISFDDNSSSKAAIEVEDIDAEKL